MRVLVESAGLDGLAKDMDRIAATARKDMVGVVRDGIRVGRDIARANAKKSAGRHGKHYPRSITSEMKLYGALGLIAGEYGPDPALPQGGMSFESGSRNQKPHLDLARSADIVGPAFASSVRETVDGWFW